MADRDAKKKSSLDKFRIPLINQSCAGDAFLVPKKFKD